MDFNKEVFTVLAGKSTDLEWFMFEAKIRQVICDLMEPLQQKQQGVTEKFKLQHQDFQIIRRKLEELEFTFHKV